MVARQRSPVSDSGSERWSDSDSSYNDDKPLIVKKTKASRSSNVITSDDEYRPPTKVAASRRRAQTRGSAKSRTAKTTKRSQKGKLAAKSRRDKRKTTSKVTRGVQTDEEYKKPQKRTRKVHVQIAAPRRRAQRSREGVKGEKKMSPTKESRRRRMPAIII